MTENTINNKDEKYSPMLKFLSNEISSSNLWRIEWLYIMLIAIVIDLLAIRVFGIPKSITFLLSAYLILLFPLLLIMHEIKRGKIAENLLKKYSRRK
jgi:hypothetical protein